MALSFRQQLLVLLAEQDAAIAQLFNGVLNTAQRVLYARDDAEGRIPPNEQEEAKQRILAALTALFLAQNLQAFEVQSGVVIPRSPLARVLWQGIQAGTRIAVEQQRSILRQGLRRQPDLLQQLERATGQPTSFTSPYDLVRSSGRTLADSIAHAAVETRRKVRLLLDELFAEQRPVREILTELERFLTPGKALQRSKARYGTTGVYDALTLARSEPMLAYGLATRNLLPLNPFVTQVWVERSHSGAKSCPICDPMVDGSPYNLTEIPLAGFHAHCLCRYRFETRNTRAEVERLRGSNIVNVRGALHREIEKLLLRSGAHV